MDDKKSKTIIVNICYLNESESKIVHISVNMSKIKDAKNESVNMSEVKYDNNKTKDEEPLVTDNSVINATS